MTTIKTFLWAGSIGLCCLAAGSLMTWLLLPRPAPLPPVPLPVLPLSVPAEISSKPGEWAQVPATTEAGRVCWRALDGGLSLFPEKLLKDSKTAVVMSPVAGKYRLLALASVKGEVATAECVVVVGTPPVPPGPLPPDPPKPTPSPMPGPGMRVLIVYESAELSKMPAAQQAVIFSKTVRDYLNAKCVIGADNKTREWRMWDKDVATDNEGKVWQDAMKRERKSVPWLIISSPEKGGGFEGPLPASVSAFMELIKKYGGE